MKNIKQVYIIGGPMGVGKTTACRMMKNRLNRCVFLDGDWCWDMHPFQVTEDTKKMVMENIAFLLNQFIHCPAFETIVFCWVLHQQEILLDLLSRLDKTQCHFHLISLVCEEKELEKRVMSDVQKGLRDENAVEKSLSYLPLYENLTTSKLDVTGLTPEQTAERIVRMETAIPLDKSP